MKRIKPCSLLMMLVFISLTAFGQNASKFLVKEEAVDNSNIERACSVDDLIIFISSNIDGLTFESNVLPNTSFIQLAHPERDEYAICHPMEDFILTMNCQGYESVDLKISGAKSRYKFKVTGALVKGTLNFKSKPGGCYVELAGMPKFITPMSQSLASSGYAAKLSKNGYISVDTMVTFPIDASKDFNFELKPDFPMLKLDILSIDSIDFREAPILWIDGDQILLDGYVNKSKRLASFDGDLVFNTVYEGNIIPVKAGAHQIKIEAPGFDTFELPEKLRLENGKVATLKARLIPFYGKLNVIDDENNEGAEVYLEGKKIGNIPLDYKLRIGTYNVALAKPGFKTQQASYPVVIEKNMNYDLPIPMYVFKQVYFITIPTRTKVWLEQTKDSLLGHTPFKATFQKGQHVLRFEKSGGYSPEKYNLVINESTNDNDTIRFTLKTGHPVTISSELRGMDLEVRGVDSLDNVVISPNLKTPAPVSLPYGKYSMVLKETEIKRFKGKVKFNALNNGIIKLPCYANKSFKPLSADYYIDFNGNGNGNGNNMEATFGQSYFLGFTGLTTSIFNVQYYNYNSHSILIANVFLLNWDFRLGGSIFKNLDICALGRFKYTPGLRFADLNINGYSDAVMMTGFYGVEVSSRLPYFNINCKAGYQHLNGTCYDYNTTLNKYETTGTTINTRTPVISFGITLNGNIAKSNNMLRLWSQPPLNISKGYAFIKSKLIREKSPAVKK